MQSNRSKILEVAVRDLATIVKGNKIPNLPQNSEMRFNSTVKLVSRSLSVPEPKDLPAVFVFNSKETVRHLLADITSETMEMSFVGYVHSFDDTYNAQDLISDLYDDVRYLVAANPKFDGYARRSRIIRNDHDTEVEEPDAVFLLTVEVDYIEAPDYGNDPIPIPRLPITCNLPQAQRIMNGFFNALATTPGIASVQEADVWPVPNEQIQRRDCPLFIFQTVEETYEYHGSTDTTKRINVVLSLIAVELDLELYPSSIDTWISRVKDVLGDNADLGSEVNTIDIRSIRATRSEYPVIYIEVDATIRYMQSFLKS